MKKTLSFLPILVCLFTNSFAVCPEGVDANGGGVSGKIAMIERHTHPLNTVCFKFEGCSDWMGFQMTDLAAKDYLAMLLMAQNNGTVVWCWTTPAKDLAVGGNMWGHTIGSVTTTMP